MYLGEGLIANGEFSEKGALEIAIFHMTKAFFRNTDQKYLGEESEYIHITMGYRHWLNETFSLSAAFYSAYSMGEPHVIHSDFATGTEPTTSANDTTEYGVDLSVQAELYQFNDWSLLADGRYSLSVTPKPGERADHVGFMLAVKYVVQDKK